MYLRYTTRKKDGKVHRYWRLVRSVRVGRRVIQQTVAQLGELDGHGRLEARALARHLIGEPQQARLFDDGSEHITVPVRLKGIRVERARQFGDVYLALALWRGTGLAELCEQLLPVGKERVAWEKMAAVLVAARLCEPSSELHIAEDWYRRTALSDLLQLAEAQVNKDRLYRALDELLVHKAALEAHLSRRCGELFALGNEVFPGNTSDSCTVQTIVTTMEARHGVLGRVWIADRGMSSAANLAWLRDTGRRYIIGAPKSELKKFATALAATAFWRKLREGVEVKLTRCLETHDTIILCRSAERRTKERAIHEKFSVRIDTALARLAARIERSRARLDRNLINRQIGRILQANQRAAARFEVRLIDSASPAGFHLQVAHNAAFDDWAALSEGAYLLRSNITDWSDEQLWKSLYPALAGGSSVSHPEGSAACASHLASARRSRSSPHPRVLPGLRAVENAR